MKLKIFAVLFVLVLILAGCQEAPSAVTTTTTTAPPPETTVPIEQLALVVTEDTISQLEEYPSLKQVDLTGSTCYAAIAEYMAAHPNVLVTYTVTLGTLTVGNDTTSLILDPGTCDYDTLSQNLAYLPAMESVSLPRTNFSAQEITALKGLYPDVAWDYTVILLGQELTAETTEVNLSVLEPERVEEAMGKLSLFPEITKVELMDAYGKSLLSKEDVKTLQGGAPNAVFHYVFELFGKTVSTTDERIEFVEQEIGNEGEEELRSALDILRGCSYLLLDDCGFDNEVLAAVREDYRETTKVVWRVYFGKNGRYDYLTDTDTIRAVYNVTDTTCDPMKYCEEVKYMDLGHNDTLTNIEFIAYMPELEIVILSGSAIDDLTPFSNSTKLVFLELAWCGNIEDVSPLAGCTSLAHLNLSYTDACDLTAIYNLPFEQLCAVKSDIKWDTWEDLMELHPDATFRYEGSQCYGTGWRYKKNGAYTDIYAKVREVFQLDEVDKLIAAGAK